MFNLQGSEIIFILLLALVVLGPEKLPGAIRKFTETYNELRKMGTGFQTELKSALDEPMREMKETAGLLRDQADPKKMMRDSEEEAHDSIEAERDAERRLRAQELAASRQAAAASRDEADTASVASRDQVGVTAAEDPSDDGSVSTLDAPTIDELAEPPTFDLDDADVVDPITRDTISGGAVPASASVGDRYAGGRLPGAAVASAPAAPSVPAAPSSPPAPALAAPTLNGHSGPSARPTSSVVLGDDEMTPPRGTDRVAAPSDGAGFAPPAPAARVDDDRAPTAHETP